MLFSKNIDPDVLDTWFSAALWPFATLGWPDKVNHQQEIIFHELKLGIDC